MATLNDYLSQVENLLHDVNNVFWTQNQLTTYINEARERTVRDTGCLRNLQTTTAPLAYNSTALTGVSPTIWAGNTAVTAGQYVFSNIYNYVYTQSGTSGNSAPVSYTHLTLPTNREV